MCGPADRNPDACGGEDFLPVELHRLGEGFLDAFRDAHGVARIADVLDEDRELIPAKAGQRGIGVELACCCRP